MPRSIIPSTLLLPKESVKLGRFVTRVDHPLEAYHEPSTQTPPATVILTFQFDGRNEQGANAGFGAALVSLLSAGLSKRAQSRIRIAPTHVKEYTLDNSEQWFDDSIRDPKTKKWIERASLRGDTIYMIVGIQTLTDARIIQSSLQGQEVSGQAAAPMGLSLAAAGVIAPLTSPVDPAIHGHNQEFDNTQTHYVAPGEQICALRYRQVRYKWFSSRRLHTTPLSGTRHWSCMEGDTRTMYEDEEDDDEDMIEVSMEDITELEGEPDGEWDTEKVSDGDGVYLRI